MVPSPTGWHLCTPPHTQELQWKCQKTNFTRLAWCQLHDDMSQAPCCYDKVWSPNINFVLRETISMHAYQLLCSSQLPMQRKKHSIKLYKRFEWRKHLHPRAAAAPGIKEAKYRSVKVAICSMPEPTAAGIITAMTCQQSKSQKPSWFLRINNLHKTVRLCMNIVSNAIYKRWFLFARQL
jgi:hypothetical protein